jgi:hypothetical protein
MCDRKLRVGFIVMTILTVVLLAASDTAFARGRSSSAASRARGSAARQASRVAAGLKVAQQVQAAAQREQAQQAQRASDAASKLSADESELQGVKADETKGSEERKQLEAQIEQNAGPDHPVALAKKAYEHSKAEMASCRAQALHSQAWQSQAEAAEKAGKSHAEIADLEQQMLQDDPDYSRAYSEYSAAEAKYQQLRHELFSRNDQWKENVAAARHTQAQVNTAEGAADGQARRKIIADTEGRKAARVAAAAAAEVSQRQAYLDMLAKRYHIKINRQPTPSASSSGK